MNRKSPFAATLLFATAVCLFTGGSVIAQTVLDEETVARTVRERNPEVLAARNLITEAEARADGSGKLTDPELETEFAAGKDGEGRVEIGFMQRFPVTAKLKLAKRLSGIEIERARLEVLQKERELVMKARSALYKLAASREALSLAERQAKLAEELAASLRTSAGEGLASNLDATQAALAADQLTAETAELLADEAEAAGELATLLGMDAGSALATNVKLVLPENAPGERAAGMRPELQLAGVAVEAGNVEIAAAKASRWEDVGVGVFVEGERTREESEGLENEGFIGMRVSVPLPVWQDSAARVREKEAAYARQQQELEALRLASRNQVLALHRAMRAHHRAALRLETQILSAARKHLEETTEAYQRGEIDIQSLFRTREQFAELESAALKARLNYHVSRIEWLAAAGESTK